MSTLYQKLGSSSLSATLRRLETEIKAQPGNADLRAEFVQFLCLSGDWSRALVQLKSWLVLKPQASPTVTLLEQTLQGEHQRTEVLAGRARPKMPEAQWPWLSVLVSALAEPEAAARQHRLTAFEIAEENPGELNKYDESAQPFTWLMDGDARLGPVCEVIVNGDYFWLPFSAIAEINFKAPVSVTDLVWRHALVRLKEGREQVCQIPARYPLTPETAESFMLGCTTEWQPQDDDGVLYLGRGQKVWLNDGAEFPLLSLDIVSFK